MRSSNLEPEVIIQSSQPLNPIPGAETSAELGALPKRDVFLVAVLTKLVRAKLSSYPELDSPGNENNPPRAFQWGPYSKGAGGLYHGNVAKAQVPE